VANCGNSISVRPWMASQTEAKQLLDSQGCSLNYVDELVDVESRIEAEYPLVCGGIGNLTTKSLTFGKLEGTQMWSFTYPGAYLSVEGSRIAQNIRAVGVEAFYGSLFRASFQFSKEILERNNQVIANSSAGNRPRNAYFFIGIHSRHMESSDFGKVTHGEESCISSLLKQERLQGHYNTSTCAMIITSDRSETESRLVEFSNSSGCISIGKYVHS